jgi:vacuolar protein sorting-associated protein 18
MIRRIDCDSSQFREQEVTAVGFNYENTSELSTGNILLGTSRGLIFEADIGSDGDKLINNNWKQVRFMNQLVLPRFSSEFQLRKLPSYIPLYGYKEIDGLVLATSTCSFRS